MNTTTELARRTETNHTHLVAVFLAEERDGSQFLSLFERHIAMLVQRNVLTNHIVHQPLHLTQFLVGHFLEVREVETKSVGADV